jgi:hypothetical protein
MVSLLMAFSNLLANNHREYLKASNAKQTLCQQTGAKSLENK